MRDNGSSAPAIRERGGPGGTTVHLDDLRRLATLFRQEARELAEVGWRSRGRCLDPDLALSAGLSPGSAAAAEAAILRAVASPGGALGAAAASEALATSLEAAAGAYEHAEAAAETAWTVLDDELGLQVGLRAPAIGAVGVVGVSACHLGAEAPQVGSACGATGNLLQSTLTGHPELVEHLIHGGGGLLTGMSLWAGPAARLVWPGGVPPVTTRSASRGVQRLFVDGTPVVRTRSASDDPGPPAWRADPEGVAGVGALVQSLGTTAGLPGGAVDVRRVTTRGPGGSRRTAYIVNIPGTDSWLPPPRQWRSRSAPDLGGNLRLVGDQSTVYSRGVVEVMARAGIPRDAPVLLVGHSEGGMTAYKVAEEQRRLRLHPGEGSGNGGFNVTHVITAGSPLATMSPPHGVKVLSLEASGDLVKDLDGGPNPDRLDHLTVRFELDSHSITGNHGISGYAAAAAGVDRAAAQGDTGAAAFVRSLEDAGFVAGEGQASVATAGWTVDRAVG